MVLAVCRVKVSHGRGFIVRRRGGKADVGGIRGSGNVESFWLLIL